MEIITWIRSGSVQPFLFFHLHFNPDLYHVDLVQSCLALKHLINFFLFLSFFLFLLTILIYVFGKSVKNVSLQMWPKSVTQLERTVSFGINALLFFREQILLDRESNSPGRISVRSMAHSLREQTHLSINLLFLVLDLKFFFFSLFGHDLCSNSQLFKS